MNGSEYTSFVKRVFCIATTDAGFKFKNERISGNLYIVEFESASQELAISSEPESEGTTITLSSKRNNSLTDYDNRLKTPRLSDLNMRYAHKITKEERLENNYIFRKIVASSRMESSLLKQAKEVRLLFQKMSNEPQ